MNASKFGRIEIEMIWLPLNILSNRVAFISRWESYWISKLPYKVITPYMVLRKWIIAFTIFFSYGFAANL